MSAFVAVMYVFILLLSSKGGGGVRHLHETALWCEKATFFFFCHIIVDLLAVVTEHWVSMFTVKETIIKPSLNERKCFCIGHCVT